MKVLHLKTVGKIRKRKIAENAAHDAYRETREMIREAVNQLNRILATHYDRGPRYDRPDQDTLQRLARAADVVNKATHILAMGTSDDKPDPYDE